MTDSFERDQALLIVSHVHSIRVKAEKRLVELFYPLAKSRDTDALLLVFLFPPSDDIPPLHMLFCPRKTKEKFG